MEIDQSWLTAHDGRQIFYRSSTPASPKAVLLLVHGLSEHSGRYIHVIQHFVERGFAVYAPDHRGHGRSAVTLGDLESMDAVVGDLGVLHRIAAHNHPGLPVCVLGHSMGGLISVLYTERSEEVHALVTNGAALDIPDDINPVVVALAPVLAKLLPRLAVEPFYEPNKLSRDPEVRAKADADPLHYKGRLRARTGNEILKGVKRAIAGLEKLTVPLLATHGTEDKTVPPRATEALFGGAASNDKTLHFFEGLLHECHNEPEKNEVMTLWSDWLLERL